MYNCYTCVWNNVNGYHWQRERREFILESAKSFKTRNLAERDLRRVCKKLGIKVGKITYEE